jgi:hypothetical protein
VKNSKKEWFGGGNPLFVAPCELCNSQFQILHQGSFRCSDMLWQKSHGKVAFPTSKPLLLTSVMRSRTSIKQGPASIETY